MLSLYSSAQLIEFPLGKTTSYDEAGCTDQAYGVVQCEVNTIFGNLVSVLNITFPMDTEQNVMIEIAQPILENINKRISVVSVQ